MRTILLLIELAHFLKFSSFYGRRFAYAGSSFLVIRTWHDGVLSASKN